jgi:hypothetical protein
MGSGVGIGAGRQQAAEKPRFSAACARRKADNCSCIICISALPGGQMRRHFSTAQRD